MFPHLTKETQANCSLQRFFKVVPNGVDTTLEPTDETGKGNRFVCCECGKQYATSSNLSRHRQTHRSLDSQSAKKCMTCGKAYVSMPALAMHVLTHKLAHSCGVCGKQFSRPWLLQGRKRYTLVLVHEIHLFLTDNRRHVIYNRFRILVV